MYEQGKLTIHHLKELQFTGPQGGTMSRVVRVTTKGATRSYAVDMTSPASAAVTMKHKGRSSKVRLNGSASAIVRLISAAMSVAKHQVKSAAISFSGAKPLGG